MKNNIILTIIILLSALNTIVFAQRYPDRFIIYNPFKHNIDTTITSKAKWMNSLTGRASFGKYTWIRDSRHAWYQDLTGFIEVLQKGNTSITFQTGIEFIADPNNDIRFNPTAIFWEEGLLFTQKLSNSFFQVGYYHRCKHDIDNLDTGYGRVLIYGSIMTKWIFPISLGSIKKNNSLVALRTDFYTIRQDYRYPEDLSVNKRNLKQLLGTTGIFLNFNDPDKGKVIKPYFHGFSLLHFYSKHEGFMDRFSAINTINFDGGFSSGITIRGAFDCRFGIRYEYLSDTNIEIDPKGAHLFSIVIEVLNSDIIK